MRVIELDAKSWSTVLDFYDALLAALGAPPWHGTNIDALIDSMVWGGINSVKPPYTIRVKNLSRSPTYVIKEVELAKRALSEARMDHQARSGGDVDVQIVTTVN
jgi:RNAse (barnase) inhibitor barstar